MPSMRPYPLNRRAPAAPALPEVEGDSRADEAARAGGFHESSYELQHGLQVSESDWPDDVTLPGVLGER